MCYVRENYQNIDLKERDLIKWVEAEKTPNKRRGRSRDQHFTRGQGRNCTSCTCYNKRNGEGFKSIEGVRR